MRSYGLEVPPPYTTVCETPRVPTPQGWYQHWSIVAPNGKKLKGAVMIQRIGNRTKVTTYRDGVHVEGVDVPWLLTRQQ